MLTFERYRHVFCGAGSLPDDEAFKSICGALSQSIAFTCHTVPPGRRDRHVGRRLYSSLHGRPQREGPGGKGDWYDEDCTYYRDILRPNTLPLREHTNHGPKAFGGGSRLATCLRRLGVTGDSRERPPCSFAVLRFCAARYSCCWSYLGTFPEDKLSCALRALLGSLKKRF